MPYIFDAGRKLLDGAFAYAAILIKSYKRGETAIGADFPAKPAKTVFSADALYMNAINLRFSQIDFLIMAKDLTSAPELADILTDADGQKYEVIAPSGEPPWRWHTPTVYRVHCLRIS